MTHRLVAVAYSKTAQIVAYGARIAFTGCGKQKTVVFVDMPNAIHMLDRDSARMDRGPNLLFYLLPTFRRAFFAGLRMGVGLPPDQARRPRTVTLWLCSEAGRLSWSRSTDDNV
jgi:hypothetical protein